ncbi:MAG TPA: superoxide dismutase [Gemmataceae bacterium]|jgi:Fe-Mn family superoxide dismutase
MHPLTRRQWLRTVGSGAAALALAPLAGRAADAPGFTLPKLPYAVDALEPHIDAKTMEIHHGKHHKAYVDNLNKALANHPDLLTRPVDQLMRDLSRLPVDEATRTAVRNNGGGHSNHSHFWQWMAPHAGGEPTGPLGDAIKASFGDFAKFRSTFKDAAMKRFGSGWAWLVADGGKLSIGSSAIQDTPLSAGHAPLLGIDVWEHAYYLKYQNRRGDYIDAWWNVVNWKHVAERFARRG